MKRFVKPSNIAISIPAPASKSYAQRAILLALLSGGESHLAGFDACDDTLAAIEVARQLGAMIETGNDYCVVRSFFDRERYTPHTIECGESGLLSRIVIAIMSLYDRETTITGCGTLMNRSFEAMERPLRELGAEISFHDSKLPARIKWGMKGGQTTVDGSGGSQVLTALLMALPLTPRGGDLFVMDLTSKPYIDMTIALMKTFGVEVERERYERFSVKGNCSYTPANYTIEGDWSSASMLLVAGALAGEVTVCNLNINSLQADRKIVDLLFASGVVTIIGNDCITTRKSPVEAFFFDATDCPDLIPAAVALAVVADGKSAIKGVHRLINKESNRAEALILEYSKIGISIEMKEDALIVTPGEILGGEIDSHGDHRIAMSLSLAALVSKYGIVINGSEAVSKSFPTFFDELCKLPQ